MFHNPPVRAYCRRVGRALELPRAHKRRLLDGLERELEERFSSEHGLTMETLCRTAGSPEEAAVVLMDGVDEKVRTQYQSQHRLLLRTTLAALIVALAALVILSAIYFSYLVQHSVDHTEIRIVQYKIQ